MKRCIVIADDDPTIISLISLRLGMARFNVLSAANGEEAVRLIADNEPVACILDVQMPKKTGLDVLAGIKADPLTRSLPVMMLTGERNAETVLEAMNAGADDYMVKPFDPDTMLERISRLVKSSAMIWERRPGPVWEL